MKLNQIRHVIAVAQSGDLRTSAEACGVSTAALVRSIRTLERQLGTALFRRSKTSIVLTPVGEIFVRRAAAAHRELDRARDELRHTIGTSTGVVAIGMSADAHVAILPKILMPFQARFPDVGLRIVEGDFPKTERAMRDSTLDFYIGPISPQHRTDGFKIDTLYESGQVVAGRSGHPLGGATSLADLAGARWITTSGPGLYALFERHGLPKPTIAVEAEGGLGMLSAVAASDALLILSEDWIPFVEQTKMLTLFPLTVPLEAPTIHLVTRNELPLTPAAAFLHGLLVSEAAAFHRHIRI